MQTRELFSSPGRRLLRQGALVMVAGTLAFSLTLPQHAWARLRNVSAKGCVTIPTVWPDNSVTKHVTCSIPVGTDFPTDKLYGAWFEFVTYSPLTVTAVLLRRSYNNTVAADYGNHTGTDGTQNADLWVPAVNAKSSFAVWDFLEAYTANANDVHGVIVNVED